MSVLGLLEGTLVVREAVATSSGSGVGVKASSGPANS